MSYARSLMLILLALFCGGCSSLFRHHVENDDFSLYGNQDRERLESAGKSIARAIRSYRELFPTRAASVPAPWVIYKEDELSRQRIFIDDSRREGYYLPLLKLIHLSPHRDHVDDVGDTVILHEVAHHFLVWTFPKTTSVYWLNEGFACALEVSWFGDDGNLVTPLYHATLHQHARQALFQLGEERFCEEIASLVSGSWFRFHHHGDKTRNYALAWALVYHLLEQRTGNLEERLASIVDLRPDELQSVSLNLIRWLRLSPDTHLERLAQRPELTLWAVESWLKLRSAAGGPLLSRLLPILEGPESPQRTKAFALLTQALNGERLRGVTAREARRLRSLLSQTLGSGSREERIAVLDNLSARGRHPSYYRPMIDALAGADGELRARAAAALARLTTKATITRPEFWRHGCEHARGREVGEWQRWLADRH